MARVTQLRVYTIRSENIDAFIKEWRDQVIPLRREHGFEVDGAWVNRSENTFAWMVSLPDGEAWEARNDDYFSSPKRKAMDPDPARFVEGVQTHLLTEPVDLG